MKELRIRTDGRSLQAWFLPCFFFVSGMPALVYQVVWQRVLSGHFGVEIYSVSITVAIFLMGLGLGSLIGGSLADRLGSTMPAYAAAELLIGVFGLVGVDAINAIGYRLAGASIVTTIFVEALLLLAPAALMGATLPLALRAFSASGETLGRDLPTLYAVNTRGAAVGALLASFLLIGLLGFRGAVINALLATSLWLAFRGTRMRPVPATSRGTGETKRASTVLALSFVSGFVAIGYQRLSRARRAPQEHGLCFRDDALRVPFGHRARLLHGTQVDRCAQPDAPFRPDADRHGGLACQPARSLLPVRRGARARTSYRRLVLHLVAPQSIARHRSYRRPDALFGGRHSVLASPLLHSAEPSSWGSAARPDPGSRQRPRNVRPERGRGLFRQRPRIGRGGLAGRPRARRSSGTERTLWLIVAGAAASGTAACLLGVRGNASRLAVASGTLTVVAGLVLAVPPDATRLLQTIYYARHASVDLAVAEDETGIVALRHQKSVILFEEEHAVVGREMLYIQGVRHGDGRPDSLFSLVLRSTREGRRALLIGLGDGGFADALRRQPSISRLVIVELSGAAASIVQRYGAGRLALASDKTNYVVSDGRRWLLANPGERFDVIAMSPLSAGHAYYTNLFSCEFFEVLRAHLNQGGRVVVGSNDPYSTARTLATVFPRVLRLGSGLYVASTEPLAIEAQNAAEVDPLAMTIEADETTILMATEKARINSDLVANSEYYLTYPFAASIAVQGSDATAAAKTYVDADPGGFDPTSDPPFELFVQLPDRIRGSDRPVLRVLTSFLARNW